jgi:hypothetical protein
MGAIRPKPDLLRVGLFACPVAKLCWLETCVCLRAWCADNRCLKDGNAAQKFYQASSCSCRLVEVTHTLALSYL